MTLASWFGRPGGVAPLGPGRWLVSHSGGRFVVSQEDGRVSCSCGKPQLRKFCPHARAVLGVALEEFVSFAVKPRCPECGAEAERKRRVPGGGIFRCPYCGAVFERRAEELARARADVMDVAEAASLVARGLTFKAASEHMRLFHGLRARPETVKKWCVLLVGWLARGMASAEGRPITPEGWEIVGAHVMPYETEELAPKAWRGVECLRCGKGPIRAFLYVDVYVPEEDVVFRGRVPFCSLACARAVMSVLPLAPRARVAQLEAKFVREAEERSRRLSVQLPPGWWNIGLHKVACAAYRLRKAEGMPPRERKKELEDLLACLEKLLAGKGRGVKMCIDHEIARKAVLSIPAVQEMIARARAKGPTLDRFLSTSS